MSKEAENGAYAGAAPLHTPHFRHPNFTRRSHGVATIQMGSTFFT
jgi:hypothetical protein